MRQQGGLFYLLKIIIILAIAGAGFFCTQKARASQSILINEIMYDLKGTDDKHEWIEIYNSGSAAVDLTGWKFNDGDGVTNHAFNTTPENGGRGSMILPAGGFALLAGNAETLIADLPNYNGTVIDTVMSLSNTSAELKLFNAEGVEAAAVSYSKDSGANGNGKTLERDGNVFKESPAEGGTPGAPNTSPPPSPSQGEGAACGNSQVENGEQCDDGNLANGDGCSSTCQTENPPNPPLQGGQTASSTEQNATPLIPPLSGGRNNLGDVVINEFVSDPGDNDMEWIELYNAKNQEVDLSGWWLEDGSKAKTKLEGIIGSSGSDRYKIIEKPNGNLNNAGDLIVLYDASGKIIDQAVYGSWDDGNLEDNAPVAHDPASLARKFDGYNTFNNANDFAATLKPTKGASNIIEAEDEVSAEAKAKYDFSNDIYLSEILPNPIGDDTKLEFVEIYNSGAREVNLTGWSLSNEDDKKVNLEKISTSTIIKAGEYLVIFRPRSKIVLHNDQGGVKLYQPLADKPLAAVEYKEVSEGWSYNANNPPNPLYQGGNNQVGDWEWSETPTPGRANVIKAVNHAPAAEFSFKPPALAGAPIIFDSSDTDDPDGDSLKFSWDFGDGFKNNLANPEHTFSKSGIYKVKLAVSDGQATSTKEKSVKVVSSIGELGAGEINVNAETPLNSPADAEALAGKPSPLYQGGTIVINEVLPDPAGADTGKEWVELKNQGLDRVNLINWRVENSNGKYKFKNDLWLDGENFYLLANAASQLAFKNTDDAISLYNGSDELIDRVEYAGAVQGEAYARGENGKWFWTTKVTPGGENVISLSDSKSMALAKAPGAAGDVLNYIETDLEKIRELEIGSLVKVKGIVTVEPGILGAQIFYIVSSSTGMQVYNYKKDFPALKVGDYVEITGELAQTQDEFRIKTKAKSDISLVEHKPAPLALALSCDAISEENIGQLITITGEITSKKAYTAYLDDGNDEMLVYFKQSAGLDIKNLKAGQAAALTGILGKTSTGLRLLPRYQADIVLIDSAVGAAPQVLGESASASEWAVAERDKKLELFKYLLIIASGAIVVLIGLFIRTKKKNAA